MEFYPQPLFLENLIDGVCRVMAGMAAKKSIELVQEHDQDLPEVVLDAPKMKQVLYNLVSNAVKFSPEGSTIQVTTRLLPDAFSGLACEAFEVAVEDQGIGIEENDQKRIFDEFKQLDSGPSRQSGGTGLGLALVRQFVDLQGGRVELQSSLGIGSTFRVILPVDTRKTVPVASRSAR